MSDRYWRPGTPPADPSRELPRGAFDPPDGPTRRSVLKLLGASLAVGGLPACRRPVEHIVPYVEAPEQVVPGLPRVFATTLTLGEAAYGVLVESHEGRPGKIEGNPSHPASGGAATAWMQGAILDLCDPDRSRRVRHRSETSDLAAFAAAWQEMSAAWQGDGSRLAVLAEASSSPTLERGRGELLARFPGARWVTFEPVSDDAMVQGWGGRPLYRLESASVVLALDADLLLTETDGLRHARAFARGRQPDGGSGTLARLYAVESALTLTGANADHRLRLSGRQVGAFAEALVAAIDGASAPAGAGALPAEAAARLPVIARDLRSAGARALVAAGRRQPAAVHALVRQINERLGAIGSTVTVRPREAAGPGAASLAELATALGAGEVDTLVVLGGNPAFTAPADIGMAALLAEVPHLVHLGQSDDETGQLAEWHLPQAHALETWSDALAADGTASVVQPLVAPLHGGIGAAELVALLARGEPAVAHDLVRETWASRFGVAGEEAWRRVLHDGLLASGPAAGAATLAAAPVSPVAEEGGAIASPADEAAEPPPVPTPASAQPVDAEPTAPETAGGYEIAFLPSPHLWDGRFANNAWLQEAPHPVSKQSWGNAAWLSPATAGELGVESGDHLTLRTAAGELTLPALVLPGMADGTFAVELGHGRRAAGRVGDGVGADAYRLRRLAAPWYDRVEVARATAREELTFTQEHWSMEGRDLVREAPIAEFVQHPEFAKEPEAHLAVVPLWQEPSYDEGHQWGMVIDLATCIGCMACVTACQSENNVPVVGPDLIRQGRDMLWLRVDRYFSGPAEDPQVVFQPVPCMHCENAPCEQVCPVAATVHDPEGLNLMVYNRCIGTRYCSNNCPYKVRRFNFFNYTNQTPELVKLAMNPDVSVRSRGVMEKCTYCLQRITAGKRQAKREGRPLADGDVVTACQQTCPAEAITFGDLRDAASAVARRKASPRDYTLLAELNNQPRTSYLAKIRNPNPRWSEA